MVASEADAVKLMIEEVSETGSRRLAFEPQAQVRGTEVQGPTELPEPKAIVGTDNRKTVDLSPAPYRSVGRIRARVYPDAGAESYATGTLIGPNLLLTCSHAIQKKPDGNMWWTQFFPAQNGAQTPFPPARVTKAWRVVWVNPDNPDANMAGLDFSVMVLDKPVGKDLGFWDVAPYQPAFLKEVWGHLGYPGTLNGKATFQGGISIEKAVPLNYGGYPGLMLGTDCDQEHGQSGGPLYRMNNGKPFIIGVLHGDPHNFGVRSVFSSGTALTNLVDWARKQPA